MSNSQFKQAVSERAMQRKSNIEAEAGRRAKDFLTTSATVALAGIAPEVQLFTFAALPFMSAFHNDMMEKGANYPYIVTRDGRRVAFM